jgi:hypothetical protein
MGKTMNPDVVAVKTQNDFLLLVSFADGQERLFDVKPYLDYPVFQKLKVGNYFSRAHILHGTVVWDDQTDLSPDSLYLLGKPAQ